MMETAEVLRILAIAALFLLGGMLTTCSYLRALQGRAARMPPSRTAPIEPAGAAEGEGRDTRGGSASVTHPP